MDLKNSSKIVRAKCSKYGLYYIKCLKTNKYYIGESKTVISSLKSHQTELRNGTHENKQLQQDYIKYGKENFCFQYLIFGVDEKNLIILGAQFLKILSRDSCYNVFINFKNRNSIIYSFSIFKMRQRAKAKKLQSQIKLARLAKSNCKDRSVIINNIYYPSASEASNKINVSRRLICARYNSAEKKFSNYKWVLFRYFPI